VTVAVETVALKNASPSSVAEYSLSCPAAEDLIQADKVMVPPPSHGARVPAHPLEASPVDPVLTNWVTSRGTTGAGQSEPETKV
jgi:hypothetical protein